MDTLNQILPFYDALAKQDIYRTGSHEVRHSPVATFIPFLLKRTHSASNTSITSANLIDKSGNVTNVYAKFNSGALIHFYNYTLVDYFQYNGDALVTSLPYGEYYLQLSDGANTYYSEWFCCGDVSKMISIQFTNTLDLGDILYQHGFTQMCYLNAVLGQPENGEIKTGDTRDGVVIIEKIITMPIYKIIDWIPNSLFQALSRLPGHSSVTIIDEVDNTYSPNNIEVKPTIATFDLTKLELRWTDNEIVNSLSVSNIT